MLRGTLSFHFMTFQQILDHFGHFYFFDSVLQRRPSLVRDKFDVFVLSDKKNSSTAISKEQPAIAGYALYTAIAVYK